MEKENKYMNPYLAGVLLGLTLLASFIFLGTGLGASAGIARFGAFIQGCFSDIQKSEYFGKWGKNPLYYYLVFMFLGVIIGGFLSAFTAKRVKFIVEKGKKFSSYKRTLFALIGGIIVGFASRIARGCTSGQALSGGALLLTGSILFMMFVFIGGYAAAYFFRRQWYDK